MSPTFLVIAIVLFCVWCVLFVASRRTRQEQLVMSLVGLVLTPAILFLAVQAGSDLSRRIGAEDFIFAAAFFGVAAVIYEALFGRHFAAIKPIRKVPKHPVFAWSMRLFLALACWAAVSVSCLFILGLPMARAMLAAAMFVGVYVIADRKDLLGNAIASGACMALLILVSEFAFIFRLYPGPIDSFRVALNIESAVWAALAGFAIGPLYEYVRQLKTQR